MKAKNLLILCASVCFGFLATACSKEDDSTEKCEYIQCWELQRINEEHVPIPYYLKFINDTLFRLNTSVNIAKGNYNKISDNQIIIKNYHEETEALNSNEKERGFDERLLKSLNDNTFNFSYTEDTFVLQNDTLTLLFTLRYFSPIVLYSDDE